MACGLMALNHYLFKIQQNNMYILHVKCCIPLCLWPAWLVLLWSRKMELTHWEWVTHICVSKLTIIGSDNGLSPGRHQAIIWTNAGILLIRPLGTNLNEMPIKILTFAFMKMRLKVSSAKWRPFCLGLNVLKQSYISLIIIGEMPKIYADESHSYTSTRNHDVWTCRWK